MIYDDSENVIRFPMRKIKIATSQPDNVPEHVLRLRSHLKRLREKATPKLTMLDMAKAMGGKGASTWQHYEQKFTGQYLPLPIAKQVLPLLTARGVPEYEVLALVEPGIESDSAREILREKFMKETQERFPEEFQQPSIADEVRQLESALDAAERKIAILRKQLRGA